VTRRTRRQFLREASLVAASSLAVPRSAEPSPGQKRPNILLFFPDQHRWDWTPVHRAAPVPMPNLERLSARGVTFDRAYSASPVCAPSRACLATGREYDHCGLRSNSDNYPLGQATVYQRLREAGYRTLGCGKIDLATGELMARRGLGTDGRRFTREWGFSDAILNAGKGAGALLYLTDPVGPRDAYFAYLDALTPPQGRIWAEDYRRREQPDHDMLYGDTRPSPLADEHHLDNWIARNGLALLDAAPAGEPWFLAVNFAGPHDPLDIPRSYEPRYRGPERVIADFAQPRGYQGRFDAADHVRIRQNYAGLIENIDHWLGVYLDHLEARGQLDNTLIVFSSDHGEMLGDRSRWRKSLPWEPSVGVPLVIAGPGVLPGRRSDAMVSLIDLTATFLDYGGAERMEDMDGFSLRRLLDGHTASHREYLLSGLGSWRLAFDGRYKLITDFEGVERILYDLEEDPWEERDLARDDPERVKKLHGLIHAGSYRPT
jgi:arylsulfatase A-like enzyme